MNALDFIKQSIDTKQKELTKLSSFGKFSRIYEQTDCIGGYGDSSDINSWTDYHEGYGDKGYGDGWQDYTVSE